MKVKMQCPLHKKKQIEAICLDKSCEIQCLSCFDCRTHHQNHQHLYFHINDFLEAVDKKYNVSYLQNEFNHKCNKLKSLKSDLDRNLNQQIVRILSISQQIIDKFNSSIDQQIESLKTSYQPYIEFMQNLKQMYETPIKYDQAMFSKVRETFKAFRKQSPNDNEDTIEVEFIPSENISFPITQAKESYSTISENVSKYLEQFEILWKTLPINSPISNNINKYLIMSQPGSTYSSKQENINSLRQVNENNLSKMLNKVSISQLNEELTKKQPTSAHHFRSNRDTDLYIEEKNQIRMNMQNNPQLDQENKFEKTDTVVQMNNCKIEQSPIINQFKQVPQIYGNFIESIPFSNVEVNELKIRQSQNGKQNSKSQQNNSFQQNNPLQQNNSFKQNNFEKQEKVTQSNCQNYFQNDSKLFSNLQATKNQSLENQQIHTFRDTTQSVTQQRKSTHLPDNKISDHHSSSHKSQNRYSKEQNKDHDNEMFNSSNSISNQNNINKNNH